MKWNLNPQNPKKKCPLSIYEPFHWSACLYRPFFPFFTVTTPISTDSYRRAPVSAVALTILFLRPVLTSPKDPIGKPEDSTRGLLVLYQFSRGYEDEGMMVPKDLEVLRLLLAEEGLMD